MGLDCECQSHRKKKENWEKTYPKPGEVNQSLSNGFNGNCITTFLFPTSLVSEIFTEHPNKVHPQGFVLTPKCAAELISERWAVPLLVILRGICGDKHHVCAGRWKLRWQDVVKGKEWGSSSHCSVGAYSLCTEISFVCKVRRSHNGKSWCKNFFVLKNQIIKVVPIAFLECLNCDKNFDHCWSELSIFWSSSKYYKI